MRILVTGGAGFIGSHLVDALVALDHRVLVVDSLWEHGGGRLGNLSSAAELAQLDVGSAELPKLFESFRPELVYHLAGQHSVAIGSRDPVLDARVNILGLLNVLQSSVAARVRKVIFASSAATFGSVSELPVTESTPQHPSSPYGITKMASEHYLRFFKSEHGLDFTAMRFGNAYGPRQDPNGEAGVIAVFVARFLARAPLRIDWDGEQTRDYIYVEDIVAANLKAIERGSGMPILIGTGRGTSVNDIYRALAEVSGHEVPVERGPARPGDVRDSVFDISRARRELGWEPRVQLIEGLRRTYEHFSALKAEAPGGR